MDHLHAQQTNAPERYLLGELPPAEAEDFELHYFECQQCALAVESGEQFIAGACAYYREPMVANSSLELQKPADSFLRTPFLQAPFLQRLAAFFTRPVFVVPVMAGLAAVTIYQGAVLIPGMQRVLNTARSVPAVQLIGALRGDEPVLSVSPQDPFAELQADIPTGETYKQYLCVLTRDGREVAATLTPAPGEGQPITIQVPVGQLRSGHHDLTLFGVKPDGQRSDKVSSYPFRIEFN